jgi:hypothetical protein
MIWGNSGVHTWEVDEEQATKPRKAEPLSQPAQAFVEWATGEDVSANMMD